LGNIDYSNSNPRSGLSNNALLTQIGFALRGGNIESHFTTQYSVYQARPNNQSGWTAWVTSGNLAGDGDNPIKAIRFRLVLNFETWGAIPLVGNVDWVNGGNVVARA
jgi:hypothetical protein